jgi:predicted transcriptional regulator
MAAFWAVFTFGGSCPALTAHGSLDLKQEIQIQIFILPSCATFFSVSLKPLLEL